MAMTQINLAFLHHRADRPGAGFLFMQAILAGAYPSVYALLRGILSAPTISRPQRSDHILVNAVID
jgi:hypothetical protein